MVREGTLGRNDQLGTGRTGQTIITDFLSNVMGNLNVPIGQWQNVGLPGLHDEK
jgi:hypothetical protein